MEIVDFCSEAAKCFLSDGTPAMIVRSAGDFREQFDVIGEYAFSLTQLDIIVRYSVGRWRDCCR